MIDIDLRRLEARVRMDLYIERSVIRGNPYSPDDSTIYLLDFLFIMGIQSTAQCYAYQFLERMGWEFDIQSRRYARKSKP